MKVVARVLAGSLILFAAGCSRHDTGDRIASPRSEHEPSPVLEAHWVTDEEGLRTAVRAAAGSPLVQRALSGLTAEPRVQFVPEGAAHVVGTTTAGSRIRATILPYGIPGDSAYAVFVTSMNGGGREAVEATEVIVGRTPGPSEEGFEATAIGGRRFWFRTVGSYSLAPDGAIRMAPQRTVSKEFIKCFLQNVVPGCGAVADGCRRVALPQYVGSCIVTGCVVVAAMIGIGCALGFLSGS